MRQYLRLLPGLFLSSICVFAQTPAQSDQPVPSAEAATPRPAAPEDKTMQLTLEDCIARALAKNFDLKIQRLTTDSAKDTLTIANATYDPTLGLSTTKSYVQSIGGVSSQSSLDTRASVSQKIATGATVAASGALDRSHSRPGSTNSVYDSDVALSVSQPLLKNAGVAVNRAAINRAKIGVTRANYDFKATVLDIVRSVETAYYNLAFAREQMAVRRFSLEVAQKLLDENRIKKEQGVAIDLDVLQAEVGVANARRALLQSELTVHDREDDLISIINPLEFSQTPGTVGIPDAGTINVSLENSYKLARDNSPDIASAQLSIEQLKLDTLTAKKNRLPDLDLGAGIGYNAREKSYGRAASEVWGSDGYNWQIDLSLSLPWGLRADRARYRQALSNLDSAEIRLQQVEQSILVQVRSTIRSVTINDESLRLATLATQLSTKQFELEKARYDAGLSTFRRVQEAQEDLDTARINELQAKVTLNNALSDLARLETSSLQHYRITVEL